LNAASALITAAVGVKLTFVSFINPWWLFGALVVVAFYLIFEGWTTIRLLREMRECMRQPITVIGAGR